MAIKIVELIDVQLYRGQQCLSRYHYLDADGVASEGVLVSDYINDVLPLIRPIQSNELQHVAIRHRQVYPTATLVNETAIIPAVFGSNTGPGGPSYATYSLKWTIGDTTPLSGAEPHHIKKGGKHLPGITEDQLGGDAGISPAAQALIVTWFNEVKDPGTDPWQLVVVSFEVSRSHKVNTPTTETITKAVQSTVVTKYAPVTGASPASASTQNTRKVLRGRTF